MSALVAASVLIVGYTDLWMGGVVVAPILITLAYVVLVPVAMVAVPVTAKARK